MQKNLLLAATFVMALSGLAQAQGLGGGFGRDNMRERIPWYPSVDKVAGNDNLSPMERRRLKAMGLEPSDKKYIFVYIRPLIEEKEPNEFSTCQESLEASRGSWAFVKMDFDKENVYQKAWGIKAAPACIGCDLYANDFMKMMGVSVDTIRSIVKGTPERVTQYEAKLKSDFTKASEVIKTDEEKGLKQLVDVCLFARNGYKETAEAQKLLNDQTEAMFKKGELASAVSPEAGSEYFDDLVKIYKATAPGLRAETVLAILEHARGAVQPAIARLQKVLKSDPRLMKAEIEAATKALDDISKAGDAKIEAALAGPDKALARESIRKLAKEYAGTEAGKHAADASK
jgi:hypothetical protein